MCKCPICKEELGNNDYVDIPFIRDINTKKPLRIHEDCSQQKCTFCLNDINLLQSGYEIQKDKEIDDLIFLCPDCVKEMKKSMAEMMNNNPDSIDSDDQDINPNVTPEVLQNLVNSIMNIQGGGDSNSSNKPTAEELQQALNEFYDNHSHVDELIDENGNLKEVMKQPKLQKVSQSLKAKIENYSFQYSQKQIHLTESDHKEVLDLVWDLIVLTVDALHDTKGHENEYLEYFQMMKKYIESLLNDLIKFLYNECNKISPLENDEILYFAEMQKYIKVIINGIFIYRFTKPMCLMNYNKFKELFYDLFD